MYVWIQRHYSLYVEKFQHFTHKISLFYEPRTKLIHISIFHCIFNLTFYLRYTLRTTDTDLILNVYWNESGTSAEQWSLMNKTIFEIQKMRMFDIKSVWRSISQNIYLHLNLNPNFLDVFFIRSLNQTSTRVIWHFQYNSQNTF